MRAGARSAGCIRLGQSGNRGCWTRARSCRWAVRCAPCSLAQALAYTLAKPLDWHSASGGSTTGHDSGRLPEGGSDNKYIVLSATEVKHKDRGRQARQQPRVQPSRSVGTSWSAREAQTGGRRAGASCRTRNAPPQSQTRRSPSVTNGKSKCESGRWQMVMMLPALLPLPWLQLARQLRLSWLRERSRR